MANALYDLSVAGFHSYLGAGIGAQSVQTSGLSGTNGIRTVTVEGGTQPPLRTRASWASHFRFALPAP